MLAFQPEDRSVSNNPPQFNFRNAFSRRSMAREMVGLTEFLILGGALAWLWTSEHGRHLWVWMAVGLPLFFAYVFIGGYVRRRLGLTDDRAD